MEVEKKKNAGKLPAIPKYNFLYDKFITPQREDFHRPAFRVLIKLCNAQLGAEFWLLLQLPRISK